MANSWFRMYSEFATDPKVQMMSETHQRRLMMLFCLRCSSDSLLTDAEVSFQLRVSGEDWLVTKAEFLSRGFIDSDNQVLNWDKRQFISGGQGGEPTSKSSNYVYIVADGSQFVAKSEHYVVKIGISKNPWARIKELQTGNDKPIEIVANFRADIISDNEIHTILARYRVNGEWFKLPSDIALSLISHGKAKGANYETMRSLVVAKLRSDTTVATETTTDTEQNRTDTEKPATPPKKSARKSETDTPENFEVTAEMFDWAVQQGLSESRVKPETEQFLDRNRATSKKYSDWKAAWRTWIRNAVKFARAA